MIIIVHSYLCFRNKRGKLKKTQSGPIQSFPRKLLWNGQYFLFTMIIVDLGNCNTFNVVKWHTVFIWFYVHFSKKKHLIKNTSRKKWSESPRCSEIDDHEMTRVWIFSRILAPCPSFVFRSRLRWGTMESKIIWSRIWI